MEHLNNMKLANAWKKYHTFWAIIIVFVILAGSYIVSNNKNGTNILTYDDIFRDKVHIPTPTTTPVPTVTPIPLKPGPAGLAVETFVYYAFYKSRPYIKVDVVRYKGEAHFADLNRPSIGPNSTQIYSTDASYDLNPVKMSTKDVSDAVWTLVIDHPIKQSLNNFHISDQLFSFKKVPQSNTIVFAMQWGVGFDSRDKYEDIAESGFKLYIYDVDKNEITHIENVTKPQYKYTFPKIRSFSVDGKKVQIELYHCWGCERLQPHTLLLNLETFATKNLEETSDFMWLEGNNYLYKDYTTYPCELSYTHVCDTDPDTIPPKYGRFE